MDVSLCSFTWTLLPRRHKTSCPFARARREWGPKASLSITRDALSTVIDILKAESFYREAHQKIYEAIVQLFNNSEPVDIKTVVHQLRKNGDLDLVGGAYYIAELTTRVNSAANIEYHARIIAEQSIKRELIRISSEIQHDAYEDTVDVFQLLDRTEQSLFDVSESHIRKNYDKMSTLLGMAIQEIEDRKNKEDGKHARVLSACIGVEGKLLVSWNKENKVTDRCRD